jgi:hypothetical protein
VELDRLAVDEAVLATQSEAGTSRTTEGQQACDQKGPVDQCFRGEHGVKLQEGEKVGKSNKREE